MNKLGKFIKQRRLKLKLSVAEAAREAEISTQYWYMIETGKRRVMKLSTAQRIARTLETIPLDILGRCGE